MLYVYSSGSTCLPKERNLSDVKVMTTTALLLTLGTKPSGVIYGSNTPLFRTMQLGFDCLVHVSFVSGYSFTRYS